jgi:outer membrane biosynthesis protein TonB
MLRRMRTHRRAWTPPIPLTLLTALAVSAPLGLAGCQKVKELTGQTDEAENTEEVVPEEEKAPEPEAKSEQAIVELETAKEAGLPEAALAPPPVAVAPMTGLDDLLALAPKSTADHYEGVMIVVRDASVFLDYVDEGANFLSGPVGRLSQAAASNPAFAELAQLSLGYQMGKMQYDAAKVTIQSSGVHLDKGIVIAEGADGEAIIIYSGEQADALPKLIKSIDATADDLLCKAIETAAGYVACADTQASLDAYVPTGAEGAASIRADLATSLPGVDFEASNIIMDVPEEHLHIAIETPPGLLIMSLAPPQDDEQFNEQIKALVPNQGQLLRGVQPGSGFLWASVSPQLLAAEIGSGIASDPSVPPSFKQLATQLSGEFLLAGHYQPAAVAFQVGLTDDAAWPAVATELGAVLPLLNDAVAKEVKIPGAVWDIGAVDIKVGTETVTALHAGLSGVPEANVLAQLTGLTIDGWMFAADNSLNFALGATPEAIGHLAEAGADNEGPSDGLIAYLPASLSTALTANQVSMIAHVPLDALHSPQSRLLITTALKNIKEVEPDLVLAFFDVMSPLSSGTTWITHTGGKIQLHMAVQAFGHRADDEGKAALAAAVAVSSGGEPAASYGALVAQYPSSPRLAAYKARSGQTQAALVASGVGAIVAASALAYPVIEGVRNEEISEELDIEEDAAEKAKEESKVAPKPKPKPKPKPQPKPEPKPDDKTDPEPEPKPEPTPEPKPEPIPVDPSDDDGGADDGGAPKPPPIIPKKVPPRPR